LGKHEFLYVGSKDGVEKSMCEKFGVPYEGVSCGKLRRYFSLQNFLDFFKVPIGILQAYDVLRRFKPDVVFSKGGFVGIPAVMAARVLGIPVVLHESDVVPGLTNKLSARFASKICISFEKTKKFFDKYRDRVDLTGNPVRKWIADGNADAGYKFSGLDKHRPVILVMGGSQGARQINKLVRAGLGELLKKFQIVHLCGKGNIDIGLHKTGYVQYEFLDEQLADVYAMCKMVVSRGGANSLAEIAYLGRRALIIPLGGEASRGDQIDNAREFAQEFAWGVLSGDISVTDFIKGVELAYNNEINEDAKFINGSEAVAKVVLETGGFSVV